MLKRILFYFIFFYCLTLLQTSFFVYFNLHHFFLNFVLLTALLISCFASFSTKLISAIIGGFFLDIFSLNRIHLFFGFYTLSLLVFTVFIEFVFKKYIRHPLFNR